MCCGIEWRRIASSFSAFATARATRRRSKACDWPVGRGASPADARRLAAGESDRFAAWRVEARSERELLLQDWLGRTRSWLAVEPLAGGGTRLCFGSGIIRREGRGLGARVERGLFRALLPGHAVYSR